MAYIETIPPEEAEGELKTIYDQLIKSRGKIAQVHTIQSLNPKTITSHMELYMDIMYSRSPIDRATREMIAVVVSAANECPYCITHHGVALNHFWKDPARVDKLTSDISSASLTPKQEALAKYARSMTLKPGKDNQLRIDSLKNAGCSDREILDASLIMAYFNFVNRLVLGLGVELEENGGEGYKFD